MTIEHREGGFLPGTRGNSHKCCRVFWVGISQKWNNPGYWVGGYSSNIHNLKKWTNRVAEKMVLGTRSFPFLWPGDFSGGPINVELPEGFTCHSKTLGFSMTWGLLLFSDPSSFPASTWLHIDRVIGAHPTVSHMKGWFTLYALDLCAAKSMVIFVISVSLLLPGVRRDARTATQLEGCRCCSGLLRHAVGGSFNFAVEIFDIGSAGFFKPRSSPFKKGLKRKLCFFNHHMGFGWPIFTMLKKNCWRLKVIPENEKKKNSDAPFGTQVAYVLWGFLQIGSRLQEETLTLNNLHVKPSMISWKPSMEFRKSSQPCFSDKGRRYEKPNS